MKQGIPKTTALPVVSKDSKRKRHASQVDHVTVSGLKEPKKKKTGPINGS